MCKIANMCYQQWQKWLTRHAHWRRCHWRWRVDSTQCWRLRLELRGAYVRQHEAALFHLRAFVTEFHSLWGNSDGPVLQYALGRCIIEAAAFQKNKAGKKKKKHRSWRQLQLSHSITCRLISTHTDACVISTGAAVVVGRWGEMAWGLCTNYQNRNL